MNCTLLFYKLKSIEPRYFTETSKKIPVLSHHPDIHQSNLKIKRETIKEMFPDKDSVFI